MLYALPIKALCGGSLHVFLLSMDRSAALILYEEVQKSDLDRVQRGPIQVECVDQRLLRWPNAGRAWTGALTRLVNYSQVLASMY